MLLHCYGSALIVSWTINHIIAHLTALTFNHNFFQLFVSVQNIAIGVDHRCVADLTRRVKVIIVEIMSLFCITLLRNSIFFFHHLFIHL